MCGAVTRGPQFLEAPMIITIIIPIITNLFLLVLLFSES